MGLLEALRELGEITRGNLPPEFRDAAPMGNPSEFVILTVVLDVEDKDSCPLLVRDVDVEIREINGEDELLQKLPYIPSPRRVNYQMLPFLKLGRPKKKMLEERKIAYDELVVDDRFVADQETSKLTIPSIVRRMVLALEKEGILSPGSTRMIYEVLRTRGLDIVQDLLVDKEWKKKNIVVALTVRDGDDILWPPQVRAFMDFFRAKMTSRLQRSAPNADAGFCPICGGPATRKLSDVLKFATLDKPGFLPMLDENRASFYICDECFSLINSGLSFVRRRLSVRKVLPGITLWVVPEVMGSAEHRREVVKRLVEMINEEKINVEKGSESRIWRPLSRLGENVVLHLLFVRGYNDKVEIRSLIEDVPPSRLERLAVIYRDIVKRLNLNIGSGLNALMWNIRRLYIDFHASRSGKDKNYAVQKVLKVYSDLLMHETLDSRMVKIHTLGAAYSLAGEDKPEKRLKELMGIATVLVEMGTLWGAQSYRR